MWVGHSYPAHLDFSLSVAVFGNSTHRTLFPSLYSSGFGHDRCPTTRQICGSHTSDKTISCYNFRISGWRYRLGVRTEDSQSSNPGSIPGSATNYHPPKPANSAGSVFAQKSWWRSLPAKSAPRGTQNGTQRFRPEKGSFFDSEKHPTFGLKRRAKRASRWRRVLDSGTPLGHTFGTDGDNSVGVLLIQD